jgi:carbonic anhydrase/acetyltransferase-like protein (isoleucine patch superfamily)
MAKVKKYIIPDDTHIDPFNEPARELNVLNKPLKLAQREVLAPYCDAEVTIESLAEIPPHDEELLVYRDNLYFDAPFIKDFLAAARQLGLPCRVAFKPGDNAIRTYAVPLSRHVRPVYRRTPTGRLIRDSRDRDELLHYELDMWYFPHGYRPGEAVQPLFMSTDCRDYGYYTVPDYMSDQNDLRHFVTKRTIISIESWVHLFFANVPLGIFSIGHRFEVRQQTSNFFQLRVLLRALIEQAQVLSCSELVKIGKNCVINPTAVIQGPTIIGDDCVIGPGVVIQNCIIGNNVQIDQGNHLMLSVIGDGCFLPFRSSLYLTVMMESSIVAQNTCLQMCVIGRNTFIGAGSTFTDYNLLPKPLQVATSSGQLENSGQVVLGSCVGHNCRIGSGMVVYPGRSIESDVILFAKPDRRVVRKNIRFDESDHHDLRPQIAKLHKQKYPRRVDGTGEEALLETW